MEVGGGQEGVYLSRTHWKCSGPRGASGGSVTLAAGEKGSVATQTRGLGTPISTSSYAMAGARTSWVRRGSALGWSSSCG